MYIFPFWKRKGLFYIDRGKTNLVVSVACGYASHTWCLCTQYKQIYLGLESIHLGHKGRGVNIPAPLGEAKTFNCFEW